MTEFSFQLYSARHFPPVEGIFGRLAALGYTQVEGYSDLYKDPAGLAEKLKANGLAMPTAHFSLDDLKDVAATTRIAGALGVRTVICPAVPWGRRSPSEEQFTELATLLGSLATSYRNAGFGFAWHNHEFEFVPTASGNLPMNIILELAPGVEWEVDVAWMVKAKQAPFDWLQKYGPRITAIHVKDIALPGENANEDGWADVGYGTLDWQQLYSTIKASTATKYYVMEHDNPSDVDRFASRSIATAKKWK
jgi:sugar phosphate isomerase/epimerase